MSHNRLKSLKLSTILLVALTLISLPLAAQEESEATAGSPPSTSPATLPADAYKGVTPGSHDVVEHTRIQRLRTRASNELTWVGYQKADDKDRVFLQFDNVPLYDISQNGNELVIRLEDTAPTAKNFKRPIDTSAFNSRVAKITTSLNKRKKETTVTITFNGNNDAITTTENGYLFIDFPKPQQ